MLEMSKRQQKGRTIEGFDEEDDLQAYSSYGWAAHE